MPSLRTRQRTRLADAGFLTGQISMPNSINIKIIGLEKVTAALSRFPQVITKYMGAAGKEASEEVLDTVGLRRYPPAGPANFPPTPYYIRGRGLQTGSRNYNNSERLGTQFYVQVEKFNTTIGNRASYAKYVVGEQQARAMGRIGWASRVVGMPGKIRKVTRIS